MFAGQWMLFRYKVNTLMSDFKEFKEHCYDRLKDLENKSQVTMTWKQDIERFRKHLDELLDFSQSSRPIIDIAKKYLKFDFN